MNKKIRIPFNKPFLAGNELKYIQQAIDDGKISGNGNFTQKCHSFFSEKYDFYRCFLTSSGTDALEMAALLLDVKPGDEVIIPSFTFVSTANAFALRGAKIVFADSQFNFPNIDVSSLESLITPKTRVIICMHYAGAACNMGEIMRIASNHNLYVVEDAALAIDSYYLDKPLGSLGHVAAFSFHETKNIMTGEGGMLVVNDEKLEKRAEILWEKGTNRAEFFRGETNKYSWVDLGSSFLPSEITAGFLFAQLESIDYIQTRRKTLWERYFQGLASIADKLPVYPEYASNNAHEFFILCDSLEERTDLINFLADKGIMAVFHYLPLHESPYFKEKHDTRKLIHAERYSRILLRLPLYFSLEDSECDEVIGEVLNFYNSKRNNQ